MNFGRLKATKRATQYIFLVCGLAIASRAPMVPYAKDRLMLNEADLGLLLLFLGGGALLMMPLSGLMINKVGTRITIMLGVISSAVILPLLLFVSNIYLMALVLFIFGCTIGTIDVAMNSHGIQVQNAYNKSIMSSLHGLFSVGGLFGSLGLGFLMKLGLQPIYAALSISFLLLLLLISQFSKLLDYKQEQEIIKNYSQRDAKVKSNSKFQWLDKQVLLIGLMCFIVFLSEGAMLDWSAVFLRDTKGLQAEYTGIGYAAFSVAMAVMRLWGDSLIKKFSNSTVVITGSLVAASGLVILIYSPWLNISVVGYLLLGAGAANIVPVFFSEGGRIPGLSPTVTIPAITTMGYSGQLAGPALLGFIAHRVSLTIAFEIIALLFILVAVIYKIKNNLYVKRRKV